MYVCMYTYVVYLEWGPTHSTNNVTIAGTYTFTYVCTCIHACIYKYVVYVETCLYNTCIWLFVCTRARVSSLHNIWLLIFIHPYMCVCLCARAPHSLGSLVCIHNCNPQHRACATKSLCLSLSLSLSLSVRVCATKSHSHLHPTAEPTGRMRIQGGCDRGKRDLMQE